MKQLNVGDVISFPSNLEFSKTNIPGIITLRGVTINGIEHSIPCIIDFHAYLNYLRNQSK